MNCIVSVKDSRVKVEERKTKAVFVNDKREDFVKGHVDGCLVTEGIRADYFVCGQGKSVLVELKGSDVAHACDQLFSAVAHPAVKPHLNGKIGFLIVCTRYPSHDTKVQNSKERARKKFGAKFIVAKSREFHMSEF